MRASAVFLLLLFACAGACHRSADCHADDYQGCTCADGSLGYATCGADGTFGTCAFCGMTPGLDGSFANDAGDAEASSAGGPLPLYSKCSSNADCESGLCYNYTAKGTYCTHPCSSDMECAPPSPQCTPKGVCKLP